MREVGNGVFIDTEPGVVHKHMGPMIVFHLDGHQGQSKIFVQGPDLVQRQHHPEASTDKVSNGESHSAKWWRDAVLCQHRQISGHCPMGDHPYLLWHLHHRVIADGSGQMQNVLDGGGQIGWTLHIVDKEFPGRHTAQASRQFSYRCT